MSDARPRGGCRVAPDLCDYLSLQGYVAVETSEGEADEKLAKSRDLSPLQALGSGFVSEFRQTATDEDLEVQRTFDIREYTDTHHDATVPHTLVLAPGLVIDKVDVG